MRVRPGDQLTAGQVVAACGNSGNSSDPHVHFQLMDGPDVRQAVGLPLRWEYADADGQHRHGVPENHELSVAPDPRDADQPA